MRPPADHVRNSLLLLIVKVRGIGFAATSMLAGYCSAKLATLRFLHGGPRKKATDGMIT